MVLARIAIVMCWWPRRNRAAAVDNDPMVSAAITRGLQSRGAPPIARSRCTCGTGTRWLATRAEEGHVVIKVRDSGPGMPPQVAARAFEAFYTTKDAGKAPASA